MSNEIIDIVADIRNKLSPFANLIALLETEKSAPQQDLIWWETNMCKENMPIIKEQLERINRIVDQNLNDESNIDYKAEVLKLHPTAFYAFHPNGFKRKHRIVVTYRNYPFEIGIGYGYCSEDEAWKNAYEKL